MKYPFWRVRKQSNTNIIGVWTGIIKGQMMVDKHDVIVTLATKLSSVVPISLCLTTGSGIAKQIC